MQGTFQNRTLKDILALEITDIDHRNLKELQHLNVEET